MFGTNLTPRRVHILRLLRRFYYLRTAQIRDELAHVGLVKGDDDHSVTRADLRRLLSATLVKRHFPKLAEQPGIAAPPVFALTIQGSCALAEAAGDEALLLSHEPTFKDWMSLNHACALSTIGMKIQRDAAASKEVKLVGMTFEHELADPSASDPSKRYKLYQSVGDDPLKPIKSCPDMAIASDFSGWCRCWLMEYESGADSPARVWAKKRKGHALLIRKQLFQRYFPSAKDCRVLMLVPTLGYLKLLQREIKTGEGAESWLFGVSSQALKGTVNLMWDALWYTHDKGPLALMPRPADVPPPCPAPEAIPVGGGGRK